MITFIIIYFFISIFLRNTLFRFNFYSIAYHYIIASTLFFMVFTIFKNPGYVSFTISKFNVDVN